MWVSFRFFSVLIGIKVGPHCCLSETTYLGFVCTLQLSSVLVHNILNQNYN